jgi:hypothetical protein
MFEFNLTGVLALVATAMCWSLAVVLFRVGRRGTVARKLSVLLVAEGITLLSSGYIDLMFTAEVMERTWYDAWFRAEFIVHTVGDCVMLALYPPFLATALDTKMTRPLGTRKARLVLALGAILLAVLTLSTPMTMGGTLLYISLSTMFTFALVASVQAWRTASAAARTRARSFAIAFGVRDLFWGYVYANVTWQIWGGTMGYVPEDINDPIYTIYLMGTLLAVPLIAYGILRTQLFDIDLRIQWTIKQSTLAGAIVAILFIATEAADRFLTAELGNFAGLLAAAIVVFFLTPLQRFAERVASAAMPNTKRTPEYVAFRKMQVYESAVSEALQEGGISDKERKLLGHLRTSLEISEHDAEAIEQELTDKRNCATA